MRISFFKLNKDLSFVYQLSTFQVQDYTIYPYNYNFFLIFQDYILYPYNYNFILTFQNSRLHYIRLYLYLYTII